MDIARTDLKQRKRKRILWISGISFVALAILAWAMTLDAAAPTVPRDSLWIDIVKQGEFVSAVRGAGTLVPKEIRWITSRTDARVERIVLKPGAEVKGDTVILELSSPEAEEQLAAALSAVEMEKADVSLRRSVLEGQRLDQLADIATINADYEGSRLQTDAEKALVDIGIVSRLQYQRSVLAMAQLKSRFEIERKRAAQLDASLSAQTVADQSRLARLQNTFDLRKSLYEDLQVKAGIDGVLQEVSVEVGQNVASGTNLARVARQSELIAQLRIPETQARVLKIGQKGMIDLRSMKIVGTVTRVDPAVRNGTVLVDLELEKLPADARPDLSIDGTIEIEKVRDTLYLGRPALAQGGREIHLFKLEANDDYATRVPVLIGRSSANHVEIQKGLQPGDRVILSDTSNWDKHDRIRLR
ncbi:MAG: HlyD family efflux transporter periplasmic adaptor subunit [Pseudomonadota bacterium]|nr:HlyD family efflux transporter periplasmic adaptor subunit [Pseudomonadota bacterium]